MRVFALFVFLICGACSSTTMVSEQDDAKAQWMRGNAYLAGEGVPQDLAEAAKWYRLAALQGGAMAQFSLGDLYYSGLGVPQDYVEAHKWLSISAAGGSWLSGKSRDIVASHMTPPPR